MVEAHGSWAFDEGVAADFVAHARRHIPHYESVIDACVGIALAAFPQRDAKIIDVGSATGYTMQKLRDAGFANVYGVDSSRAMLDRSIVKENLILSECFPADAGPFDMIIANWTLHFIGEREAYLRDIFTALKPGGIFVLSEKMESTRFVHDRYHDFKRAQGVSDAEIAAKEASIEGVLTTKPLDWYLGALARIGFSDIDVIDAAWCFRTILCKR